VRLSVLEKALSHFSLPTQHLLEAASAKWTVLPSMPPEAPLVLRLLMALPTDRGRLDAAGLASELGADIEEVRGLLSDLRRAGLAERGRSGWRLGRSELLLFLQERGVGGEFTQSDVVGATGLSQPVVSRRLKILVRLGIVAVARTAGVPGSGGRVTYYERIL